MKKTLILGAVLSLVFLTLPALTLATNDRDGVERGERMDNIKDRHGNMREAWNEKKEDWRGTHDAWKEASPEERLEMRKKAAHMFGERFNFMTRALQNIHDRMQIRLDKIEAENNVDGSTAQHHLDEAQAQIDSLKEKTAEVKSVLESDMTDEEKEARREEIKSMLTEIKTLVKSAHEQLKQAFMEMKKLRKSNSEVN